jgi:hypothetical protein
MTASQREAGRNQERKMSNGLTISYPYQRQAMASSTMLLLVLGMLLVHFVILRLASISSPEFERPVVEHQLRLSMAPIALPTTDPPAAKPPEALAPEQKPPATPALEPKPPEPQPAKALDTPEKTSEIALAAPPPPAPEVRPSEPLPEAAAAPKPVEPNLAPLVASRTAWDTAIGQEKPPENAKYEGPTNSKAADRSSKEHIGDDPKVNGESAEVSFIGRRGEDGNKDAKRAEPTTGSVEKEGSPTPGKPPDSQRQMAGQPEPETESAKIPEPKPEDLKVATAEPPARPDETAKKPAVSETEPDGVGPLKQNSDVVDEAKRVEAVPEKPMAAKKDVEPPSPNDRIKRPAPVKKEPELAQAKKPATPLDPELARLQRILDKPSGGPDSAISEPGIGGTRSGQVGHEGDGKMRPGELDAVSDTISATVTSAAEYGDVQFSKRATPENAYLKLYYRRMDAKWKAVFFSGDRALSHLEFGTVQVRFTLDKSGSLVEAVEVGRTGTVSDTAARACLEGLRRAAPHDAFPDSLAGREKLTETIVFLYR